MTNKEYLSAQLGFAPSGNTLDAALLDAGITGSDTYSPANKDPLKKSAIQVLKVLLSTADVTQGTGETANSIKYDRNAILKRISDLEEETNTKSDRTIKAVHPW